MSCNRTEISDNLLLYLDGGLSQDERRQTEEHVSSCPDCQRELQELGETTSALQKVARLVKERSTHVPCEDLVDYQMTGAGMDAAKKVAIEAHLALCKACTAELELLKGAPASNGESPEEAPMPASLLAEFDKAYGAAIPEGPGAVPAKDIVLGFWGRLRRLMEPPMRLAYVAMASLVLIFLTFGILEVGLKGRGPHVDRGGKQAVIEGYEEVSTSRIPEGYRTAFCHYLQDKGITARMHDGKILIRADQMKSASTILTRFEDKLQLAREGPGPDVAQATPEEDDDRDDFFYNLPGKADYLVMDAQGEFPRGAPSSVYGRQPIISAFSMVEDRESDVILGHFAQGAGPGMIGTDMAERERETLKIQEDFQNRIGKILKDFSSQGGSTVKVFATLSFQKGSDGRYGVQSVTVIIENPHSLNAADKDKIQEEVKKSLPWKKEWDENFLFVEK